MNKKSIKLVLYYKSNALLALLENIIFQHFFPGVPWDKTGGMIAFLPLNNALTQTRWNDFLLLGY